MTMHETIKIIFLIAFCGCEAWVLMKQNKKSMDILEF